MTDEELTARLRAYAQIAHAAAAWGFAGEGEVMSRAADRITALLARAEAAEAERDGPIKPLTEADYANIIAHLSYELEPTGPLPNRNSAFMALVHARNEIAAERETVARLEAALTLAANRLHRRAVDFDTGSRAFIETSEWAEEARAALTQKDRTND